MKWVFYDGAYSVRVHIMEDDSTTIMMSAHVFPDEEEANAFAELWKMSNTEEQRNLLWVVGKGLRRDTDLRDVAMKERMAKMANMDPAERAARERDLRDRNDLGRLRLG